MTEKLSTKEKIIQVASRLFSIHGLEGTSIRDISNEADVNVASINYHFENKQNLYLEVMVSVWERSSEKVKQIVDKHSESTKECALAIFEMYQENRNDIVNAFKLILNPNIPITENFHNPAIAQFGPPGGEALLEVITNEFPEITCIKAKAWAVKNIFTIIGHTSLLLSSNYIRTSLEKSKGYNIEAHISHSIDAALEYLKKNHSSFE